jgi:drug/metabolite transporter (DMT)-like permease
MSVTATAPAPDRTLAALGAIIIYAAIIGFTDNFVQVIARDTGLWQFHATRTAMALVLIGVASVPMGLRLRPVNGRAVLARSLIHGAGILAYFGCLGFLPVAVVAAGLFTAPVFVLLISRFAYGRPISGVEAAAVALGFAGVVLVLGPGQQGFGIASVLPVAAGALYALGNIATREWCGRESAATLLWAFFGMLGVFGLIGIGVLAVVQPVVPAGAEGFILRGAVRPSGAFLFWTFVQAAGSVMGVGMMVRAYQMADAKAVSVFEYAILPASAFWSWAIWGEVLGLRAVVGIALIAAAGLLISAAGRGR